MPPKLNLTEAEALKRILEQNCIRQTKHRNANKDAVNLRRRKLYDIKKQNKNIPVIPVQDLTLDFESVFAMPPAPKTNKLILQGNAQPVIKSVNLRLSKGIIYFIQPCELVGTNRYKVGCSNKPNIDRCKNGYRKGTRFICILECYNPFNLEGKIKKIFNLKFTLIAGKEFYEGNESLMLKEFMKIWKEQEDKEEQEQEQEQEQEDKEEQEQEHEEEEETSYQITTAEEFLKFSEISKFLITNKKKLEGYLKFPGSYWRKLYDVNSLDWDEDVMEDLKGFIENNEPEAFMMIKPRNELINWVQLKNIKYSFKNKISNEVITFTEHSKLDKQIQENFISIYNNNCKFINAECNISEIIKDIVNKCFVKNPEYYNLSYNEYVFWEPSQGKNCSCEYFILDSKTFEYKHIDTLDDKIITRSQIGERGLYIHGTIDTNMVFNILSSLISIENINKFRKFAYYIFAEKPNAVNIFYDYNEQLLSTWIDDTLYTILGNYAAVESHKYYDNKKEFIKNLKNINPRCVFIYTSVQYSNGTVKKYKSAEQQIDEFKKLGCKNFIVKQNDKNMNMYNLTNFRNYLKENKEIIINLGKTKGNENEVRFVHDDEIFYTQGLLQADFLKFCCTK
jgi:hypothetical protein